MFEFWNPFERTLNGLIFFGGVSIKEMRYIGSVWRSNSKRNRHGKYFARVLWVIPKMEYLIYIPNIRRICYKENSPCEFPQFKWIKDPYDLFSWFEMQRLMTWWHDDMMQCTWCNEPKQITRQHSETWKASVAPVLGRHNTPPLREDLVPRSRMAPEGQRKRKRRGKTKLLLWPMSETKEPCKG